MRRLIVTIAAALALAGTGLATHTTASEDSAEASMIGLGNQGGGKDDVSGFSVPSF